MSTLFWQGSAAMREPQVGSALQQLLDSMPPEMARRLAVQDEDAAAEDLATDVRAPSPLSPVTCCARLPAAQCLPQKAVGHSCAADMPWRTAAGPCFVSKGSLLADTGLWLQPREVAKATARRRTHRKLRIISGSAGGESSPCR